MKCHDLHEYETESNIKEKHRTETETEYGMKRKEDIIIEKIIIQQILT